MLVSLEEALAGGKSTKGGGDAGRNSSEVCCRRAASALAELRLGLCRLDPLRRGCRYSFTLPFQSLSFFLSRVLCSLAELNCAGSFEIPRNDADLSDQASTACNMSLRFQLK